MDKKERNVSSGSEGTAPGKPSERSESTPTRLMVGFTHSLNWSGEVPAYIANVATAHELTHRITIIPRNPLHNIVSLTTVFGAPNGGAPSDVAAAFIEAYFDEGNNASIDARQGSYPNKHRVEFDVPPGAVVVHTMKSRNYGDGAVVPPDSQNPLKILKDETETQVLSLHWANF